jgi:uncharacterized protein involved in outer membrane biogenesis
MAGLNNKKSLFRTLGILGLLISLYAAFGFWAVPKLLRSALMENAASTFDVKPTIGHIAFNPFFLQLELKDCSLSGNAGDRMVGFERLFVDFELASLWRRAFVFKAIELDGPFVNAAVSSSGALNLMALQPKSPPKPSAATDQPLPRIGVASLKVSRGSLNYADASRRTPFTSKLQPIDFELRDFTTGIEGGRFTFSGASKLDERLEWHGKISVQPIASSGEFRIQGLRATTVWDYFKDRLNFVVNSGLIDVDGHYQFALRDPIDLQLAISRCASRDLAISPSATEAEWISLPQLAVESTSLDLAQRLVKVGAIDLHSLKVLAWLDADGKVNLASLAAQPGAVASEPAEPAKPAAPESRPWRFELGELKVADANISAEDRSLKPAAAITLAPVNLQIKAISSDLSRPVDVTLDAGVNGAGRVSIHGKVSPDPVTASLHLQLSNFDLKALQPYIAQRTAMSLKSGRFQLTGDLKADTRQVRGQVRKSLGFTASLGVDNLHTIDNALGNDLVNWQRLEVRGLKFQTEPDRLSIEQVNFRKPYARVIIAPDKTLNIARVLAGNGADAALSPPKAATAVAAPAVSAESAGPVPKPMAITIRRVSVENGEANFADLSIQPNFAAGIQALEGTVLGLSSDPESRAKVKLSGEVNQFSPVAIDGEINVFSAALFTDVNLSFRNMELTTFNPYSGKFAGYSISKGKLTTELRYRVQDRKLEAEHHVVIDQLEFGAKTASKDAVTLPIKLAVALLKDRHGVIDLSLPVTGTLDDPHFRIGPIIWKVLVNLLVKAVTAPFALLGALFGGGPDLQFVDFAPGLADLDGAAQERIKAVGKALAERPQLKIELPIAAVPELDREAMVNARFHAATAAEIQAMKLTRSAPPGAEPADLDAFDAATQVKILTALYQRKSAGPVPYPAIPQDASKDAALDLKREFLLKSVRSAIVVSDAELRSLGQQRAEAMQKILLAGGQIDPARVFLVVSDKAKAQGALVRLELSLQ